MFHSPHVLQLYITLCAFLALGQLGVWIVGAAKPKLRSVELKDRLNSWWKIFGVTFLSLYSGIVGAVILFGCVSVIALYEYKTVLAKDQFPKDLLLICFLGVPVQYVLVYYQQYELFLIFVPLLLHALLAITFLTRHKPEGFIRNVGLLNWGCMLTIFSLSHIVYFMNLDDPNTVEVEPIGLITFVIVITQWNDIMQYVSGKLLGRHKVLPLISPKKTWEGLIGGLLITVVASAFLGPYITRMDMRESMYSGLVLGICGFFGDVIMSAIKRDRNTKDFGKLLPGHGGVLDRVDSLILSAPVFFHFYRTFFVRYIGL